jgi:thiol peroxidase
MGITFKGNPIHLADGDIAVGAAAPEVEVVASNLSPLKIGGASGKTQVIVTLPSLDTGVCATETRKFNVEAASLPNVQVVVISMDLPFAAGRFCTTEGIANVATGSDFRSRSFAKKYGVLMTDGPLEGLLARAVFVIDKNGKLAYKEVVSEVTTEPNYEAAIKAAKSL